MTSLWFQSALLPTGWAKSVRITFEGGRIGAVLTNQPARPQDLCGGVAIPGLANVHSHGFQRGMAGLSEVRGPAADTFWTWRQIMYRFLDRLTPDDVQVITALAYAEMLETGFTHVGEFHYLHHDPSGAAYATLEEMAGRITAAAIQTGIGLTLLPVFYAHGNFGGAPATSGQRRFLCSLDQFSDLFEACRRLIEPIDGAILGLAPHSLRAVTPEQLLHLTAMAPQGPIHIHVAEQEQEVADCLAWSGSRPVDWLLDHHPVDGRWCLIHATHMTPPEVDRLAKTQAVAGLCPITEANLGDGVFSALRYFDQDGALAVGTDSNILIDAAAEIRGLEYSQRLRHRGRNLLTSDANGSVGRALFNTVLAGGDRAMGRRAGGLCVGAAADIISLDDQHPSLYGRSGDAVLDGWIFAARDNPIDRVWRAGRLVVDQGRHICRSEIVARYRNVLTRLALT